MHTIDHQVVVELLNLIFPTQETTLQHIEETPIQTSFEMPHGLIAEIF
jgi:hypothetical protein